MKKIEAYIRPEKLDDLKDALCSSQIDGLSLYEVMGCGNQKGWKEFVRGSEVDYNFLHKMKIEMVVPDEKAESIIELICNIAQTGEVGDGKIFVSSIQDAIRIRTRERGVNVIK